MKSGLSFLIAALRCEISELDQLARTSELVGSIGRLVHAFQRERGVSNVFLASGGRRFAEALDGLAEATRPLEAAVRAGFDQLEAERARVANSARLFSRIAWVLPGLDGLPEIRRRIAARECDPGAATAAFVKLVAGLLAVVFEAADGATDPEISRLLVALFNLMQGKEFAGQERACGAAAFASGVDEAARRQHWLALIASQERCLQLFAEFAPPAVLAAQGAPGATAETAELERLRRIACAAPAGVRLDPELSAPWFDCCTRRIDAMQAVEEALAHELRRLCEAKKQRARQELQAHEALLASLVHHPPPPAALFYDAEPAGDPPPSPARAGAAPTGMGRQLERSVLEMLHEQSDRLQTMRHELEEVRAALNERKLVERAKGLLMAHRGLSEQDAHKMLRQTAMNQNRRLVDVAESVLSMAELMPARVASPARPN